MKYYHYIKLWYWWNFTIKCDEFHNDLTRTSVYLENNKGSYIDILLTRRHIAHLLDAGSAIMSIPIGVIKQAKL